ncbi:MAG: HupE/UreJ family protein, partial [Gemmatimonadota bacterium]|nr:HupE/UreJ family protein [Gemmatimonadota bacterium]
ASVRSGYSMLPPRATRRRANRGPASPSRRDALARAVAAALVAISAGSTPLAALGTAGTGPSPPASEGRAGTVAHDIPADVTVQAFVAPEGGVLRFLVRVPLEAMRDIDFPLRGPGYLDLEASRPLLADAARLWIGDYVAFFEDGSALPAPALVTTRITLPSDRSFVDYGSALAHVRGSPLPAGTEIYWEQALLDALFEVPIASDGARFSIRPEFAHLGLRTVTVLRFHPPHRAERAFQYTGNPGVVNLDPRWYQAAWRFVQLGFEHILDGIDHLLFLLCLVIPFRRLRGLVPVITSFTVAHSITLIASAFGFAPGALWFPPLIETLIALSIVYMALENIVGARPERRWLLAFGFGLVHGFGFSFALRETLQFAGSHLITSLLSFNVGVELGQLFVVLLAVPVIELAFQKVVAERMGTILLSAILAHSGWHWMTDRGADLAAYRFRLPDLDLALLAGLMRWTMLALIVGGSVWLLRGLFDRWARPTAASGEALGAGEGTG